MNDRFWDAVTKHQLYSSSRNLQFHMDQAFGDIDFTSKKVLDIGTGIGLCSFYAVHMGAAKAVALEPEAAGATAGVKRRFDEIRSILESDKVDLRPIPLQEFDPDGDKFDIIILHDSVNHLDETACERLHLNDEAAIDTYTAIFRRLYDMAENGAKLIVTDAARHNLFPMIGLRNPMCPSIVWHGHQQPSSWAKLLSHAGFQNPKIKWKTPNRLRSIGQMLLGNQIAAFFLMGQFYLTMEKP